MHFSVQSLHAQVCWETIHFSRKCCSISLTDTKGQSTRELHTPGKVVLVLLLALTSPEVGRLDWTRFWHGVEGEGEIKNSLRPGMCHRNSAAAWSLAWQSRFHPDAASLHSALWPEGCTPSPLGNKVGGEWCLRL